MSARRGIKRQTRREVGGALSYASMPGYIFDLDPLPAYVTTATGVSQVVDKAGGRTVTQGTAGLQPPYLASLAAIGGAPAIDFQNAHYLQGAWSASQIMTVSAYTIFMVIAIDGIDTNSGTIFANDAVWSFPPNALGGTMLKSATPSIHCYNFDTNADETSIATVANGSGLIYCQRHISGQVSIRNCVTGTSATTASGNTNNLNDVLRIGANYNASAFGDFKLGRFIVCNQALDDATVTKYAALLRRDYSL